MSQLNDKQEQFCQNYVLSRNATKAAKAAGYSESSAYNQGHRLLQEERIQERLKELTNEMVTNVDVVSEIEKQYEVARNGGHGTTALKALELLSRVRGNNTDVEDQTTESLEEDIKGIMQALGFEQCFLLFAEAFPDEFDNEEEDDELLLTKELSSTTDTEAGSYDNP
jgi:phage terminase small subunit|tara:strand:+ start:2766 stop:3269 length:504 start_codon:yes stop_codon:yes gene_type:complete